MGIRAESQRDSIIQPRVASLRATLGFLRHTTQLRRSCAHSYWAQRYNPVGVVNLFCIETQGRRFRVNPGLHDAIPLGLVSDNVQKRKRVSS